MAALPYFPPACRQVDGGPSKNVPPLAIATPETPKAAASDAYISYQETSLSHWSAKVKRTACPTLGSPSSLGGAGGGRAGRQLGGAVHELPRRDDTHGLPLADLAFAGACEQMATKSFLTALR